MRTLLIDNYDSYTFNLFRLLGEARTTTGSLPSTCGRSGGLAWSRRPPMGASSRA